MVAVAESSCRQLNSDEFADFARFVVTTQVGMPYSYYDETIAA